LVSAVVAVMGGLIKEGEHVGQPRRSRTWETIPKGARGVAQVALSRASL